MYLEDMIFLEKNLNSSILQTLFSTALVWDQTQLTFSQIHAMWLSMWLFDVILLWSHNVATIWRAILMWRHNVKVYQ